MNRAVVNRAVVKRVGLVVLAPLAVATLAACGDDGASTSSTTSSSSSTSSSSVPATSTTEPGPLPGEEVDGFLPAGTSLVVVGVPAGGQAEVRARPGTGEAVAFTLPPLASDVTATGATRRLGDGTFWTEVAAGGGTGWLPTASVLAPGSVRDDTARLYPTPADRPTATTMDELGRMVAARFSSQEPPSEVTVIDGPTQGADPAEITLDVVGVPDDSIGGYRVRVFATRSGSSLTLRTVEATTLCRRGADAAGLCA